MVVRRTMRLFWPALAAVLILPAVALAQEPLDLPVSQTERWYNALWTLGLFTVLLVILGRFAWKPVLNALRDREQSIVDTIADAERRKVESEELLSQYRSRLEAASSEAALLRERSEKQAIAAREEILKQARAMAENIAQETRREIDHARREALQEIYVQTANLATEVASKIIRKELRSEDHQRLVQESLDRLKEQRRS